MPRPIYVKKEHVLVYLLELLDKSSESPFTPLEKYTSRNTIKLVEKYGADKIKVKRGN